MQQTSRITSDDLPRGSSYRADRRLVEDVPFCDGLCVPQYVTLDNEINNKTVGRASLVHPRASTREQDAVEDERTFPKVNRALIADAPCPRPLTYKGP